MNSPRSSHTLNCPLYYGFTALFEYKEQNVLITYSLHIGSSQDPKDNNEIQGHIVILK